MSGRKNRRVEILMEEGEWIDLTMGEAALTRLGQAWRRQDPNYRVTLDGTTYRIRMDKALMMTSEVDHG